MSELRQRIRELERQGLGSPAAAVDLAELSAAAQEHDGATVLVSAVSVPDGKALLELADRLKGKLGEAAIVLGSARDDRVHLIASVAPSLVDRGLKANQIITVAAEQVGGGGGGRDTLARAGGRDSQNLPQALEAARAAIEAALRQNH